MEEQRQVSFFGGNMPPVVTFTFVVLATFLFAQTVKTFSEYSYIGAGIQPTNTISVTGEGEVFAVPDIAQFSFSVMEEGATPEEAQTKATARVNAALAFVRGRGVPETDVRTSFYNLTPRYESVRDASCVRLPCPTEQRLTGFIVNQTIEVKLRNTKVVGEFVTGLAQAGVQNVSGPNFTVDDDEALISEARAKAIADAKTKAEELARQLGVKVARIVNFSEGGYGAPYMTRAKMDAGFGMGGDAPVPDMPVGENHIIVNVHITYEIR